MMQKKRVLVLVEHFGQGGAERVAMMVAQMLAESGRFDVFHYAVYDGGSIPQLNDIQTGTLGIQSASSLTSKFTNYYHKFRRLSALKKKLRIDLTISSLFPVDWMNAFTVKDKKAAIIQINILNNQQNEKMVRFKKLVSFVYNRMDAIVLGGSNLKTELTDFFKIPADKLSVILNPINTKQIDKNIEAALPYNLEKVFSAYKICTAANRLNPIKNTDALVDIYKALAADQNTKFLIIGEGEEKQAIQKKIKEQGLTWSQVEDVQFDENANFYFLNFQTNIHNIISRSKIFLFPTKGEGLPLALLEAMYCGVPVVVSDCPNGGIGEVMEAKDPFDINNPRTEAERTKGGYLMPVPSVDNGTSIEQWKEKIEALLNASHDELQEIKKNHRERAAQFDKEIIKLQWFGFVNSVLTNEN